MIKLLGFFMLVVSCNAKTCKLLLKELGDAQSRFVYCATVHSVPVALCNGCENQHRDMTAAYDTMMSIKNCSEKYLNKDRINIVSTTQGALTSMWYKANCEDCFNGNHSSNYESLWNILDECLKLNKDSECIKCKLDYITLNDFYLQMDKDNKGNVCFDLQDSMNRTRSLWSKELKCCQREVNLTLFLIAAGLVVILPTSLFYSTVVVLTKRREAAHGVINDLEPELEDSAPSTSNLITAAILSTPTDRDLQIQANTEKIADVLTDNRLNSDSSDDESILISKKTS